MTKHSDPIILAMGAAALVAIALLAADSINYPFSAPVHGMRPVDQMNGAPGDGTDLNPAGSPANTAHASALRGSV